MRLRHHRSDPAPQGIGRCNVQPARVCTFTKVSEDGPAPSGTDTLPSRIASEGAQAPRLNQPDPHLQRGGEVPRDLGGRVPGHGGDPGQARRSHRHDAPVAEDPSSGGMWHAPLEHDKRPCCPNVNAEEVREPAQTEAALSSSTALWASEDKKLCTKSPISSTPRPM